MKITIKKSEWLGKEIKEYFANGILVARHEKHNEWFCSVKNGQRSRIRDKMKKANYFRWNYQGLCELCKDSPVVEDPNDFKIEGPDLSWGFTGAYLNSKQIKEILSKYIA